MTLLGRMLSWLRSKLPKGNAPLRNSIEAATSAGAVVGCFVRLGLRRGVGLNGLVGVAERRHDRVVGIAIARARAGSEVVRHARRHDAHRLAGVDAGQARGLRDLIGLRPPLPPPPLLWEPRLPPSRAASCALRAPWARIVGRPGGPPRLVTIIEPGRVAIWVWPAARTVMSLPNTKVEIGLVRLDVEDGDAAADADRVGRRVDDDRPVLADLAADQAQHALAGVDRELAGLGIGIEHELVDGELGIGPDRQRRAVEKEQMGAVVGAGGDELVGLHVDADAQHALGLLRRLAERIAVGGRGDPDLGGRLDRQRTASSAGQAPSLREVRCARLELEHIPALS